MPCREPTARQYNRRKGRAGAFWEGKYHATAIESGLHLWRCLRYVDLNMVRAGKVEHPSGWRWCGYDELMGMRQRYRILRHLDLWEQGVRVLPARAPPEIVDRVIEPCFDDPFPDYDTEPVMAYANG